MQQSIFERIFGLERRFGDRQIEIQRLLRKKGGGGTPGLK